MKKRSKDPSASKESVPLAERTCCRFLEGSFGVLWVNLSSPNGKVTVISPKVPDHSGIKVVPRLLCNVLFLRAFLFF